MPSVESEDALKRVRKKLDAPNLGGGLSGAELDAVLDGASQVDVAGAYLAVCSEQKRKAQATQEELCKTFERVYRKLHYV